MAIPLNETHDPARRSFVESANAPGCDFPIQNLPFGVFRPAAGLPPRVGVAIGDQILDVAAAAALFDGLAADAARACAVPRRSTISWRSGRRLGRPCGLRCRAALSAEHGDDEDLRQYLTPMAQAELRLPVAIANFTDFFASIFHASNAGACSGPTIR